MASAVTSSSVFAGRAFPVQEYYLEDCIQMTNFVPAPNDRKRKRNNDDDDGEAAMDVEGDDDGAAADLSKVCSNDYSVQVRIQSIKYVEEHLGTNVRTCRRNRDPYVPTFCFPDQDRHGQA